MCVARKRFIFGPINFDMSLKNCANYCTLEGGLIRPQIYGNPAEYANRPNCIGSKLIERRTRTRPGCRSQLRVDTHSRLSILILKTGSVFM